MADLIITQADFGRPELFLDLPHILYFSKKSPFKETCNEDALGIFTYENGFILAIADGAGGHPKGEDAAKLILQNIKRSLGDRKLMRESKRLQIIDAIDQTNRELIASGSGARTTVTICEVFDNGARAYQVGDSTLVICGQKGKLKYRSTSHSPVGYGIEAGLIDDYEALQHPDLHIISNLVGEAGMKIELGPEVALNPNDSIFLASDGIFDNFPPDQIIELIRKGDINVISNSLIEIINKEIYAKNDSKKDDISFILFKNDI